MVKFSKQLLNYFNEERGYWKLKEEDYIALCGELALEESLDLSQDTVE